MATYTAPTTRASGYLVTAANWNTDIVENIKYFKDAPTFDGAVTASSTLTVANNVGLAATKKLYLDGVAMSGDTYISESSANVLSLFSGNVEAKLTSGVLTVSGRGEHQFNGTGAGWNSLVVKNSTAGSASGAYVSIGNDSTSYILNFYAPSSTYTTLGHIIANAGVIEQNSAAGLSVAAVNPSGAIRFYSGGSTERMRLSAAGNLAIGGTPTDNYRYEGVYNGSAINGLKLDDSAAATGGNYIRFMIAGATIGSVDRVGATSAVAYSTTSDARLKRSIQQATKTNVLQQTIIRDFEWLADGSRARGVFAQEAVTVAPFAVTVGSDEMKDGHLVKPWGVDYSKYVPDLIVGWQQHDATIQSLAARIAALESK